MRSSPSHPEVFIIESLRLDNERDDALEGERLSKMLSLSDKKCRYYYIRTEKELRKLMPEFKDSGYRYLHLSCHGNREELATTFDRLPIARFGEIVGPYLDRRRVFLSACEVTTMPLAAALMNATDCYSVMGPYTSIGYHDAALFWATFYHLMFRENESAMKRETILKHGREAAKLFRVHVKLFTRQNGGIKAYRLR